MPTSVQNLLDALDAFSFQLDIFGPVGCMGLGSFFEKLLFYIFAPIALGLAIAAGCVACAFRPDARRGRSTAASLREGLMSALPACLLVSFLAFPTVSSLAFRAFSCEEFDGGYGSFLIADYLLTAMTPRATIRWSASRGSPSSSTSSPCRRCTPCCCAQRAAPSSPAAPRRSPRRLNFLHRDVEPRCYWWELCEIGRKVFLVGFVALIDPGTTVQLVSGFMFCLVYLLFTGVLDPFVGDDDDFFCTLCSFVLTAILFLCVILKEAELAESVDAYLTESTRAEYAFDAGAVSVMIIGATAVAVLAAVLYTARQLEAAARAPIIRLQSTGKVPEPDPSSSHCWHLLLAHLVDRPGPERHHQAALACCCRTSSSFDVDDLESVDKLEEHIDCAQRVHPAPVAPPQRARGVAPSKARRLTHRRAMRTQAVVQLFAPVGEAAVQPRRPSTHSPPRRPPPHRSYQSANSPARCVLRSRRASGSR